MASQSSIKSSTGANKSMASQSSIRSSTGASKEQPEVSDCNIAKGEVELEETLPQHENTTQKFDVTPMSGSKNTSKTVSFIQDDNVQTEEHCYNNLTK